MTNVAPKHEIVAYDPIRGELAALKEINDNLVFDYESAKGNKEARSHVYKVRKSKTAVEEVRKKEKAASLEYGRKVDAEAAAITRQLEEMIEVHQKPLDEIERKEIERVAQLEKRVAGITFYKECKGHSSAEIHNALVALGLMVIGDDFAEYQVQAMMAREEGIAAQKAELPIALKREQDAAELEMLRKKNAEREKQDLEEKLRKEAEEKARAEIEAKAQAEIAAAEKKATDAIAAAAKAERDAAEAVLKERERVQRDEAEKKRLNDAREADDKHKATIHKEVYSAFARIGLTGELSAMVIAAISDQKIPHIKIIY